MNIFEEIKKKLQKKGVKGNITLKTEIKNLGIDSLDLMDLIIEFEEKEKIKIDDDILMEVKIIEDIVNAVKNAKS